MRKIGRKDGWTLYEHESAYYVRAEEIVKLFCGASLHAFVDAMLSDDLARRGYEDGPRQT